MSSSHQPVLLSEVLHFFKDSHLKVFVDATLGAGGHSKAILDEHPELELLVGIDQDPTALEIAREHLQQYQKKTVFVHDNFERLGKHLDSLKIGQVDGILFDLGISSMQIDIPEKGFSFLREGPLDMRMNPDNPLTAEKIVNTCSEKELGRIFREYGEEKRWRQAAKAIVDARKQKPIQTTQDLVEVLNKVLRKKKKGIHPATLVFQALRICVNREMEVLEKVLPEAIERLFSGGRLGVITFHSLEDRLVKNIFRYAASDKVETSGIGGLFIDKAPTLEILSKKPLVPSVEEIKRNPRSRSAKLRMVQKR